ncbi:MAG: hypothetical protein HY741_29995 [Chloroflexi bacterium]|nr:hypothetical protein [Chloroflexota bacterium]
MERQVPSSHWELMQWVERALDDYHFLPRLAENPLAQYLDLRAFRRMRDFGSAADGWALRRALDAAIDAIVGEDAKTRDGARVRIERYLDWRYREQVSVREIAGRVNYSERHLQRLRDELIEQLARTLLELAPPK